jgi:hypothetical protein
VLGRKCKGVIVCHCNLPGCRHRLYDARRTVEYRLWDPEGRCWSSGLGAMFLCAGHIYFERSKGAT